MDQSDDAVARPAPLEMSRHFTAPRALVFEAWSTAEHMKRWFCPEGLTVPEAEVDFRPGGACVICMRMPDGPDFWSRGHYIEIVPPERLVFVSDVFIEEVRRFRAHTTVTFAEADGGTRLAVRQVYEIFDPAWAHAPQGASEGWRTTLDKLEREVARIRAASEHAVAHATFTLERHFRASPAALFHALTDPAAKARWFGGGDGYTMLERDIDVRPGGRERAKGRWANGTVSTFDATYFDVVPNVRLVYAYEMHLDDRRISVSLATVQIRADDGGARLTITEQGAFLDTYEDGGSREQGTRFLLERLAASVEN